MPERPDGFYWVRKGTDAFAWTIAQWSSSGAWLNVCGWNDYSYDGSDFDEIGERVERGVVEPDEREACARIAEQVAAEWSEISWLGDRIAERIRERK